MKDLTLKDIIEQEREQLRLRRQKLDIKTADHQWFGIALSGGGIRSATINLGVLRTLNRFGILKKADYLSTVSGGGYTHSYVQGALKDKEDYNHLFTPEHIDIMRQHGEYLTPGRGWVKKINGLLAAVAFVVSWAMSMVSPVIIGLIVYFLYLIAMNLGLENPFNGQWNDLRDTIWNKGILWGGGVLALHFLVNILFNYNLSISKWFNYIELGLLTSWAVFAGLVSAANIEIAHGEADTPIWRYLIYIVGLVALGFMANPNALSFHRYYRKQLSDLFLRFAGEYHNILLKDLFDAQSNHKRDYIAPYPLINTCLNLQAPTGDAKFKGSKASDYFLLSPLFCGSKLTAYVPTEAYRDYRNMTLPAAVTISAAAVNPGLGIYSNRLMSALMTLFNARLGFWISNPLVLKKSIAIVWWPVYFFKELLGRIGTNNKMVNISDGGHIENLGVYELLRRQCRLIIAVDAGEDKTYGFFDLNNLLIRARNELGLEIRFRKGQQPEDLIFPRPSSVYSQKRYAIADIFQHWIDEKVKNETTGEEESRISNFKDPKKVGTFIYIKSSVTAPVGKPYLSEKEDPLRYGTYKYKIYHPDFPHESTGDQFFDPIQWEAYYQLGQFIGADILGMSNPEEYSADLEVSALLRWFDTGVPLFEQAAEMDDILESTTSTRGAATPPSAAPEYRM